MAKGKRQTPKAKPESKPEPGLEPVCVACATAAASLEVPETVTVAPAPIEKIVPPIQPTEVAIETVSDGGLFEFKGKIFMRTRQVYSGQVVARRVVGANTEVIRATGTAEFRPGVMVIAK